jgi:hypothetical protein
MFVGESVRKCVAFVGVQKQNGTRVFTGSAFLLGFDSPADSMIRGAYFVTAKHVIDDIRALGVDRVSLRVNQRDGLSRWLDTDIAKWYVDPSDTSIDVALHKLTLPFDLDHLVIPSSMCITPELMQIYGISLGDEVLVVGLFRQYSGEKRNIPIVRVGNLAAKDEEKLDTPRFGKRDVYLIEARSIGGLSGSPVFLNPEPTRMLGGRTGVPTGHRLTLLGLISSHFDEELPLMKQPDQKPHVVNTGIAVVVPIHNVLAVINHYEHAAAT